jgi:hypothetical protein
MGFMFVAIGGDIGLLAAGDDAAGRWDAAHDGKGEYGLADGAEGAAGGDGEGDAIDGGDIAVTGWQGGAEGVDDEEELQGKGRVAPVGSGGDRVMDGENRAIDGMSGSGARS